MSTILSIIYGSKSLLTTITCYGGMLLFLKCF